MAPGCGNAGCYRLVKPHTPMKCARKPSGIGGELAAFPCTKLMAVGLRCSRHPLNTLLTSLFTYPKHHANHAEGVQYAVKSLWAGTPGTATKTKSSGKKRSTRSHQVCW